MFSSAQELLIVWNAWLVPIKSMGTLQLISRDSRSDLYTELETLPAKCKDKNKNILHQATIPPCPTFREGERKLFWWGKHYFSFRPLRFQLTGSSMPSSVSVTGSTDSYWEPATSINPQPNSLPAMWDGKAGFLYSPTLSYKNRNTVDKDKKAARAKVCRSSAAWEGEGKSYVNNNKEEKNECFDVMNSCWSRRWGVLCAP